MKENKKSAESIVSRICQSTDQGKRDEVSPLNPYYVAGFVDGEGCFSISLGKHKTLKTKCEVRLEFEIELRADDKEILERVKTTLGCGSIYELNYQRYGWAPHVKYKIQRLGELQLKLIPFFRKYPLQAKKKLSFEIFTQAVNLKAKGEHLTENGINQFRDLQNQMRKIGKKWTGNR